jgi:hypothetical protein
MSERSRYRLVGNSKARRVNLTVAGTEVADWMKLGSEKPLLYHSSSHYLSVDKLNSTNVIFN